MEETHARKSTDKIKDSLSKVDQTVWSLNVSHVLMRCLFRHQQVLASDKSQLTARTWCIADRLRQLCSPQISHIRLFTRYEHNDGALHLTSSLQL